MNIFDYLILSVLLIITICVILYLYKRKKKGITGCSSCSKYNSCPGSRINNDSFSSSRTNIDSCSKSRINKRSRKE